MITGHFNSKTDKPGVVLGLDDQELAQLLGGGVLELWLPTRGIPVNAYLILVGGNSADELQRNLIAHGVADGSTRVTRLD